MTNIEKFVVENYNSIDLQEYPSPCIEWPYCQRSTDKRGRVSIHGEKLYPYQAVYELVYGPIEKANGRRKYVVRHLCNNPACCNPEHLTIGTHKQNMQDKKVPTALLIRGIFVEMVKGSSPTTPYALKPVQCYYCKCALVEGMSYRIEDEGPVCYDCINLYLWTQPINLELTDY